MCLKTQLGVSGPGFYSRSESFKKLHVVVFQLTFAQAMVSFIVSLRFIFFNVCKCFVCGSEITLSHVYELSICATLHRSYILCI